MEHISLRHTTMPRLVFFVFLVALCLAGGASLASEGGEPALVVAGHFDCLPISVFGLKDIRLWEPEQSITEKLGKPLSLGKGSGEDDGGPYDILTYHYTRLSIDVVRGVVDRIYTDAPGMSTPFGVAVGDSFEQIVKKLGRRPREWRDEDTEVTLVTCPKNGEWIQEDYVTFRLNRERQLVGIAFEANRP
jgi:hypothetical protein